MQLSGNEQRTAQGSRAKRTPQSEAHRRAKRTAPQSEAHRRAKRTYDELRADHRGASRRVGQCREIANAHPAHPTSQRARAGVQLGRHPAASHSRGH